MTPKVRLFLFTALASVIPASASADIWTETTVADVDLFLNEQHIRSGENITKFNYARVSCREDESAGDFLCAFVVNGAGTLVASGPSLEDAPELLILTLDRPAPDKRALAVTSFMAAVAPLDIEDNTQNKAATSRVLEALAGNTPVSFKLGATAYVVQVFDTGEAIISAAAYE